MVHKGELILIRIHTIGYNSYNSAMQAVIYQVYRYYMSNGLNMYLAPTTIIV